MKLNYLHLLKDLKEQVELLPHRDSIKLDALKQRTSMLITKIFGDSSNYHETLRRISFNPIISVSSGPGQYDGAWKGGHLKFINLVDTMIEDFSLDFVDDEPHEPIIPFDGSQIFLVHGHNEEMKQSVARLIEKLRLNPIILHEQPNKGRTIIQKFIDHSNVGFAIILISADDVGYGKTDKPENAKLRARQNVILELGFFLGKLGVERVIALFEQTENFEIPSDYDGVLFIPYDPDGRWKFDLVKELKALNYDVDANSIL